MTQNYNRWPFELNYKQGYTAILPSGTYVGQGAQKAINHGVNWRFNGPHMMSAGWRPNSSTNDATGKFYPIMHYPPNPDNSDRGIAVGWTIWGRPAGGAWYLKFQDAVASYAQETIKDGPADDAATSMSEATAPLYGGVWTTRYKPPSAGAANLHQGNFKALEVETSNIYVGALVIWHIEGVPEAPELPDALVDVKAGDVGPGRIISQLDASLAGLHEWIGDGSTNVASLERCSRRVYCNEAHVTGINYAAATAMGNIVNDYKYPARARQFANCASARNSYPAFVITTDGVGGVNTCQLRVSSGADSWTYTVQAAEPDNTPYIITPAMAGSSDSNGLTVTSAADDELTFEAQTDAGVTLTIHSWACFEGPAY